MLQLDNPSAIAYPSDLSITLSQQLQHPLYVFAVESNNPDPISEKYSGLGTALPCHLHLLNLKVLQDGTADKPSDTSALFLHRMGYDCRFGTLCNNKKVVLTLTEQSFELFLHQNLVWRVFYLTL